MSGATTTFTPRPTIAGALALGTLALFAASASAEPTTHQPPSATARDTGILSPGPQGLDLSLDDLAGSFGRSSEDPLSYRGEQARSLLHLSFDERYPRDRGMDPLSGAGDHVRLPRLNEPMSPILPGESADATSDAAARDLGLGYTLMEADNRHLGLTGGVRLDADVEPFAEGRYRHLQPLGSRSQARLTQRLFWRGDEGFGESTQLDIEARPAASNLLRWRTTGLYSESSDGWEWRTGGDWFGRLSERSALNFGVSAEGATDRQAAIDSYGTHLRFSSRLMHDWLSYEIESELRWPRSQDYDLTPGITLRLRALLGD